jgi:hypothetical protein
MFVESFSSTELFDGALYFFVDERLCTIAMSGSQGNPEEFDDRVARLFQGSVKKWGEDYERVIALPPAELSDETTGRDTLNPGLLWQKGGLEILVSYSYPPRQPGPQAPPPSFGLMLSWKKCRDSRNAGEAPQKLKPAPGSEFDLYFEPLNTKVAGPLFE